MNADISALTKAKRRLSIPWIHAKRFIVGMPVIKLIDVAVRWSERLHFTQTFASHQSLNEAEVTSIIDRIRFNYASIQEMAARFNIGTLFVWQPSPAYKYDLSDHIVVQLQEKSLHGHERAGDVYPALEGDAWDCITTGPNLWLGNMHENEDEALYVDSVHYTSGFSQKSHPESPITSSKINSLSDSITPSVLLATLPKSGTDFTVNNFMNLTSLKIPEIYTRQDFLQAYRTGHYPLDPELISTGNFDTQYLLAVGINRYAKGGTLIPTHMGASYHNLYIAQKAGIKNITVMIREPRDATISLTYHIRKAGPELRNLHSEFQYLPCDYFDWGHEQQLAFQVRVFLPRAINWIEGWYDAIVSKQFDIELQFIYFDEMRQNSKAMLSKIIRFHGLPNLADDSEGLTASETSHFRSGTNEQWRDEFSALDQSLAIALLGDRLERASEKAASAILSRALMCKHQPERQSRLMSVIETAPWSLSAVRAAEQLYRLESLPAPWKQYINGERKIFEWPALAVSSISDHLRN